MKRNFDELIECRANKMATVRCPYDVDQLCRLAAEAIGRSGADDSKAVVGLPRNAATVGRSGLWRYGAAACVALLLGVGTYWVTPLEEGPRMYSVSHVANCRVEGVIISMINHGNIA